MPATKITAWLALTGLISLAHAEDIAIKDAWVRATVPGQPVAAAYMEITSEKPAALIKVETTAASKAEIHSMKMENGVMRMGAMPSLPLPAKETVRLAPGSYHLMLMGLRQPLKPGSTVTFRLTVKDEHNQEWLLSVDAPVKNLTN